MITTRTKLAFSFTLAVCGCFANTANALDLREVSPNEITIMKQVAAAGAMMFTVRSGTEITDTKGQKHKLVVALRGQYRLAEAQPTECLDKEKINQSSSGEYYYDNKGQLVKHGPAVDAAENPNEIQVPARAYVRLEKTSLFSKSELFCVYELEKAGLALAVDSAGMLKSMWTNEIPVVVSEADVPEASLDYTVNSIGWHGAYPTCQTQPCSISINRNSTSAVKLNFVRRN